MEQTLNKYEGMFVLNPSRLAADELTATTVVTELVEKYGGKPVRIDVWDEQRKLAYPIDDQKRGTYVLAHFEAEGEMPDAVSKAVNINEVVMRWLCTRHQETFPEFKVASEMEGARRRDGDREGGRKSDGDGAKGDAPKADAAKTDAPKADAPAGDAAPAAEVKDSAPAGDGEDQGDKPSA